MVNVDLMLVFDTNWWLIIGFIVLGFVVIIVVIIWFVIRYVVGLFKRGFSLLFFRLVYEIV